jgi:predicted PurR-regulated permease PerM
MAVPWLQIVQLVPSIVEVSRELLKRSKRLPPPQAQMLPENLDELATRVMTLEENERRQAELVSEMAEQMAALTRAVTALHKQIAWITGIAVVALIIAIVATGFALR